jgi:hypothetical protein
MNPLLDPFRQMVVMLRSRIGQNQMRIIGVSQIKEALHCRYRIALAGPRKTRESHRPIPNPAAAKHQAKING